ncbi:MAG TPA: vWA domain-containing protein [Woeseiaceae bacterium]|jgi:Mg-chelatase subunit ChlD|nr:vWA domain-containing protein [Woeseiaceae bacterium]
MKTSILATALFVTTFGAVLAYPTIQENYIDHLRPQDIAIEPRQKPKIDVVFVLDTTGSMGGLIQTAKEKIWSIATTMASAQPTPEIRIGLVGFRDRGDQYVTRIIDLSSDLDSVYAELMDFQADGGGDAPESVNEALYAAVHRMSWTQDEQAYRVLFLVGDAPPHMDYPDDIAYPEILAAAGGRGIVVNTIQCGELAQTAARWQQIASLGGGTYFRVEQAGGAVALATPYDEDIAKLSARLDETRLYYGTAEEKARMRSKVAATEKLHASASVASEARRGTFNVSSAGEENLLGENELVADVTSGRIELDDLAPETLPESLQGKTLAEQKATVFRFAGERGELKRRIQQLAEQREAYLGKKVAEAGGAKDSLDQQIFDAVQKQAGEFGLVYPEGPDY